MNSANRKSILIIEPSEQLREEIFNFLLSAGYENVAAVDSLPAALSKINQSDYEVTIADAGNPLAAGLKFAEDIARIGPNTRIIFMINVEDQQLWDRIAPQSDNVRFLIKTDIARNLLYLLEEDRQP